LDLATADFDYHLPPERIAQTPVEPRDAARLLVIHRSSAAHPAGDLEHRRFRDLGEYLRPGDLLVANDSRVLPGRIWARRASGGRVELLLLRPVVGGWWEALARPVQRLRPGQRLTLIGSPEAGGPPGPAPAGPDTPAAAAGEQVEIGERTPSGALRVRFDAPVEAVVARYGHVPLPPYIHAPLTDPERYQTVYSRIAGSAAAPTAGLHFTPALLDALAAAGVRLAFVTLHVGPDTFRPVRAERVLDHEMHSEFVAVPDGTARAVAATRRAGGRVVAVGTTAVRSLESWAAAAPEGEAVAPAGVSLPLEGWSGWTRLFIYPGYRFRVVDALLTNFHLPRSTLMMLVSAFAGTDLIRRAYATAIREGYRFYSFGDATLIV
jgi:S-adenosylmethionine:tRNA ribosyltransferase-isomerase